MTSVQAKITRRVLFSVFSEWDKKSIIEQRKQQERIKQPFRLPAGFRFDPIQIEHISAEWFIPANAGQRVMLYLHGGAYALGSISTYREFLVRLAAATQTRIFAINYRLAPENPYPAALCDALTAYRWLLDQAGAPSNFVLAGDSAGAGLSIASLLAMQDQAIPLPSAVVCFSPWIDLTLSGETIHSKSAVDPILSAAGLSRYADGYAAGQNLSHPWLSPVYADLNGMPPLLIQAGTEEILLDDAIRLADIVQKNGTPVELQIWDGLFHVFQLFSFLPETAQALKQTTEFLDHHVENPR